MTHALSRWLVLVVIALVAVFWWMSRGEPEGGGVFVGFGGGPPGGSFFPSAGAVATFVEQQRPDLNITVEGTGGSGENVRLVNNGDTDMGVAYGGDLHAGYFGTDEFADNTQTNLRAVGLLFWGYAHLVTLQGGDIGSVADLEGRRLAIGGTGSGSALTGERYFRHLGLLDRMDVSYLGGTAASTALKDGQVDAYHWVSGVPNGAVLDTMATHDVRLVDMAAPAVESGFLEAYPYYRASEIPADRYDDIDAPVPTVLMGTYWIVNAGVPDDIVYDMATEAYSPEGAAFMRQTFEPLRDMTPDQALQGLTVPLHPGAQRYWEEVGIDIPESLRAR